MYKCYLFQDFHLLAEVHLSSITKVCKFVDTVDFERLEVVVHTPNGRDLDALQLKEIWNA